MLTNIPLVEKRRNSMKKKKYVRLVLLLLISGGLLTAADGDLASSLLEAILQLGGLGAMFGVIFDFLKRIGLIKDGQAPVWNAVISLALAILMGLAPQFGIDIPWDTVDSGAAVIAQILQAILGFLSIFGGAKFTHFLTRGSPLGFSHS